MPGPQGSASVVQSVRARHRVAARRGLPALALLAVCVAAMAADGIQYRFSTGPDTRSFPEGDWNGVHGFDRVWCANFPEPAQVTSLHEGLMRGDAVYFLRAAYRDMTAAYIVTSTLPRGTTAAADMQAQLVRERANVAQATAAGARYAAQPVDTPFGPGVRVEIANVAERNADGPFPLTRPLLAGDPDHPATLSVHRIFARGGNRYEIALLGTPNPYVGKDPVGDLRAKLSARAAALQDSLTRCTLKLQQDAKDDA